MFIEYNWISYPFCEHSSLLIKLNIGSHKFGGLAFNRNNLAPKKGASINKLTQARIRLKRLVKQDLESQKWWQLPRNGKSIKLLSFLSIYFPSLDGRRPKKRYVESPSSCFLCRSFWPETTRHLLDFTCILFELEDFTNFRTTLNRHDLHEKTLVDVWAFGCDWRAAPRFNMILHLFSAPGPFENHFLDPWCNVGYGPTLSRWFGSIVAQRNWGCTI